jgi:hypothetical protein
MAEAPAESCCSHSGILTCGRALLTTAITVRPVSLKCGGYRVTRGQTRIAGEDDEAPGGELAVIRHARGNRQKFGDLGLARRRAGQFHRLDGTPGLEQVQGVWHFDLLARDEFGPPDMCSLDRDSQAGFLDRDRHSGRPCVIMSYIARQAAAP